MEERLSKLRHSCNETRHAECLRSLGQPIAHPPLASSRIPPAPADQGSQFGRLRVSSIEGLDRSGIHTRPSLECWFQAELKLKGFWAKGRRLLRIPPQLRTQAPCATDSGL